MLINPIMIANSEQQILDLNKYYYNQVRGTLTEVHIADIHFGALNPEYQYNILKEQFIYKILPIHFDILSINGDLFDHKFMSNSDVVMYASMFINDIVEICRQKNATLVIIHGTNLHDSSQLKLFYHYLQDPSIDIRIVEQVQFEYIKGAKILCIPELYGKGEKYYREFLDNSGEYDSVFMHGEIKGSIYRDRKGNEIGLDSTKSPVFTIEDFNLCRGPIFSGHVHVAGCFGGYFYYSGSPMRWKFGEEQEKGFFVALHNLDTHEHYVHLEPIKSFRYDTINLDHMLMQDPKIVIDYLNNLQSQGVDYIRMKIEIQPNDKEIANVEILKNYFKTNPYIRIDMENLKKKEILQMNSEALEKYDKYSYILDKNLSEYEIFVRYVNDNEGCEFITVKELIELLEEE